MNARAKCRAEVLRAFGEIVAACGVVHGSDGRQGAYEAIAEAAGIMLGDRHTKGERAALVTAGVREAFRDGVKFSRKMEASR